MVEWSAMEKKNLQKDLRYLLTKLKHLCAYKQNIEIFIRVLHGLYVFWVEWWVHSALVAPTNV